MKGVRVCRKCLDDLKNGNSTPNVEKFDPNNTLRDILKFCVPHMNLHNMSNLSLCSACVDILHSLEEHVTRCTKVEDIHEGNIPEDIDDFVKYCMRSFRIASESQMVCNEGDLEQNAPRKLCRSSKNIRKHRLGRVKRLRRVRKRVKERQNKGILRRPRSLDSVMNYQEKKRVKMPMLCGHYLNSMLSSEIRDNPSSKYDM